MRGNSAWFNASSMKLPNHMDIMPITKILNIHNHAMRGYYHG